MKQILFFATLVTLTSCVNQRQKSNITGRTDEVYFTPSDTRIKVYSNESVSDNSNSKPQPSSKNYTGSYSDRLSNFGSTNRFNYSNYQPTLMPSLMYNSYTGWGLGLTYGSYNSPFSPYYGCSMPYNNPFYANGWGGNWMTGYNPYYTYNPYMFNYNPYGYGNGYYGNYYNNYNPYYNNNYNTGGSGNYSRRTGVNSPSGQYNTTGVRNSNTTPMRSDNSSGSYNTGRANSSSGSSSGSSSSGRSGGGSTSGGSTRRR